MGLRHPNLTPVLRIRAIGEPDVILAVAGQVGRGRLFAMGDPSATINEMLRYPGNRAFVAGLAHYLVDDDGASKRQGRLFIVANRFGEEGSFGGEGTLRKDAETQLKAIAAAIAEARRRGASELGARAPRGRGGARPARPGCSRSSAQALQEPASPLREADAARRAGRRRRAASPSSRRPPRRAAWCCSS